MTSPASTATISLATAEDVPLIEAMVRTAYAKYTDRIGRNPAPMTADYSRLRTTHDVFVLRDDDPAIVKDGKGVIVGSIVLRSDDATKTTHINNVVVDAGRQGRGYGKMLLRHAEDEARRAGSSRLALFTNVKMYENLVLYPRIGYRETERRVEDGYERVYYCKDV